jgi:chromobox protein 1
VSVSGVVDPRAQPAIVANLLPAPVEDVSDEESGDIPYKDAPEEPINGEKEAEEETDDDDEEEDEDV